MSPGQAGGGDKYAASAALVIMATMVSDQPQLTSHQAVTDIRAPGSQWAGVEAGGSPLAHSPVQPI